MKKTDLLQLPWGRRFALIQHFNASDEDVCRIFGVQPKQLSAAQGLLKNGIFKLDGSIDFAEYEQFFVSGPTASPRTRSEGGDSHKKGRKGTKIQTAFEQVPTTAIPVDQFCEQYNVSLAVLRQSKRFDTTGLGPVFVRKLNGVLMIWREKTVPVDERGIARDDVNIEDTETADVE